MEAMRLYRLQQGAYVVQILWMDVGDVEKAANGAMLISWHRFDCSRRVVTASFRNRVNPIALEPIFRGESVSTTNPQDLEHVKHASSTDGVLEIVLRRWSPRAYSDKQVSAETLKGIFEAARWAASSFNEQPWRFLVGRRGDETYKKIFDSLVEFNQGWAKSAPVLILSVANTKFTHSGEANRFGLHDTGAATAYIALQATAFGLHTHSMAGLDTEKARKAFNIPDDYEIGAVTALGYLGDPDALPGQLKQQEVSPRQRKPLEEIVFADWGKAAKF